MMTILRLIRDFILGQAIQALMALFFAIPVILYFLVFSKITPDWAAGIIIISLICGFTVTIGKIENFSNKKLLEKCRNQEVSDVEEVETHQILVPNSSVSEFKVHEQLHKHQIKKEFKVNSNISNNLNKQDLAAIMKYGAWMEALEIGKIKPFTEEQVRFLDVCKGFQSPSNRIEIAWYNYKKISSRLAGGNFGYHSSQNNIKTFIAIEKCKACDRNIDFCICGQ